MGCTGTATGVRDHHQENFGAEVVCAECSQHVAGHSHLVAHGHGVEECVLCQFLTMVGTAVIAGFVIVLAATMGEVIYTTHPSLRTLSIGRHAPRAPPFM